MTAEIFAKPCAAAIIEKHIDGEPYILMQTRQKENDRHTNGMLEIPAGKIREYENIYMTLRREVRDHCYGNSGRREGAFDQNGRCGNYFL